MKSKKKAFWVACPTLLLLALSSSNSFAYTFGAEDIMDWGSQCGCYANDLSLTGTQVSYFVSRATSLGNTKKFWYENNLAEGTDISEDEAVCYTEGYREFHGMDNYYGDTVDMFVYSGHGGVNSDGTVFSMPMCSLASEQSVKEHLCNFSTSRASWGELPGTRYGANPGHLRWAALATCYSVDEHPNKVWGWVANTGLEYIVGYRGVSYDSQDTTQVLANWANNIHSGYTFKDAWFSAIRNKSTDDVGSVVSFGTTRFEAIGRRDNQKLDSERRTPSQETEWIAWAWVKARTR